MASRKKYLVGGLSAFAALVVMACVIGGALGAASSKSPNATSDPASNAPGSATPVSELARPASATVAATDSDAVYEEPFAAEPYVDASGTEHDYAAQDLILMVDASSDTQAIVQAARDAGLGDVTLSLLSDNLGSGKAAVQLTYEGDADPAVAAEALSQANSAIEAEPDYFQYLCDDSAIADATSAASESYAALQTTSVDDPDISKQWGLTSMDAFKAWDEAQVDGAVTVVTIDSGVDYDHPDLASNLILDYAKNVVTGETGAAAVDDEIGHGSHVAGIIAAVSNNATGVSGVSYNASVLPVKVTSGTSGRFSSALVIQGIDYILSLKDDESSPESLRNIRVINLSLAGTQYVSSYDAIVQRATADGVLIVAACGNSASSDTTYPAGYDNVLGVSALQEDENGVGTFAASISNYGADVDVSAPGISVYSTINYGSYGYKSGTSMATPMVSAAAALVYSLNTSLTPESVSEALENSSYDLGEEGRDDYYGYGAVCIPTALDWVNGIHHRAELPKQADLEATATTTKVVLGKTAKFTCAVDGAEGVTLTYQWQWRKGDSGTWKDSTLSTAKAATLKASATAARVNADQQYRCVVTASDGRIAMTESIEFSVYPTLEATASTEEVALGKTATFTCDVEGDDGSSLTYRWWYSKDDGESWSKSSMTGYNTPELLVLYKKSRIGQLYRCKVTASDGRIARTQGITFL